MNLEGYVQLFSFNVETLKEKDGEKLFCKEDVFLCKVRIRKELLGISTNGANIM